MRTDPLNRETGTRSVGRMRLFPGQPAWILKKGAAIHRLVAPGESE
jgi:hypothetical protein